MSATNQNITYSRCKAKNRWRSVDAYAKNGAVTVLQSLLPIKAANTTVMHINAQVTGDLPYLHDHKLLTLRWRSFQCIVHYTFAAVHKCFHPDLTIWQSFCLIQTWPCGKAERRNDVALSTLTQLKMMYHAKRLIAPAIHLFMNRYSQATSYHSPKIHL